MSIFDKTLKNSKERKVELEIVIDKKDDQGVDASAERKELHKVRKQIQDLEFTINLAKEK